MTFATGTAGKLERIEQLAAHGLNTPRLLLIPAGSTFDEELRQRLRAAAGGEPLMTVRTYHPTDELTYAKGPFAPEIPVEKAVRVAEEYAREWNVLFQEAIDVADTVLAGNVLLAADGSGAYEALAGAYRVRDVESPPPGAAGDLRNGVFSTPEEIDEPAVARLVDRVLASGLVEEATSESDEAVVIEFNVQRHPVGRLHERTLLWEWRPTRRRPRPAAVATGGAAVDGRVFGIGVTDLPEPPEVHRELVLGGKGASLAHARGAGLPIPPAIVLSVPEGLVAHELPPSWDAALDGALAALSRAAGARPVSVRSSPTVSMPGMLDTVLDVPARPDTVRVAIADVLASWRSQRAVAYRSDRRIDGAGLAVVVQAMVWGDRDDRSGSGVGFTRDPASGAAEPVVEYVAGAGGAALVGGTTTPLSTDRFVAAHPDVWAQVRKWLRLLERVFGDVQEFEFTVESGDAYLLQSRPAKRSLAARVRIAYDLTREGIVAPERARELVDGVDLSRLVRRRLRVGDLQPAAVGRVAAPGAAAGRLALSAATVRALRDAGSPVVLCAETTDPSDYPLLRDVVGLVTHRGGVTSHAAVAALESGTVAVVGCEPLVLDRAARRAWFGETAVAEGEWISLDCADEGRVYAGRIEEGAPELPQTLTPELVEWARELLARP